MRQHCLSWRLVSIKSGKPILRSFYPSPHKETNTGTLSTDSVDNTRSTDGASKKRIGLKVLSSALHRALNGISPSVDELLITIGGLADGIEELDEEVHDLVERAGRILLTIGPIIENISAEKFKARLKATGLQAAIDDIVIFGKERRRSKEVRILWKTSDERKTRAFHIRLDETLKHFELELQFARDAERDDNFLLARLPHVAHTWDDKAKCLPATRVDVREKVLSWASAAPVGPDGVPPPNVFWISGIHGCGKSAIAHSLAAQLHADGMLASCIFFKRDVWRTLGLRNVFSTLVYDLAALYPDLRQGILNAIKHYHLIGSSSPSMQFSELLVQPVKEILRGGATPMAQRIVIWDAIDECSDWRAFLDILKEGLPQVSPLLKFIIISRPSPEMRRLFDALHAVEPERRCHLDRERSTDYDIECYLRHGLKSVAAERGLLHDWPIHSVDISPLIKRADSLFSRAARILKSVERSRNPPDQLAALLAGDPFLSAEEALRTLIASAAQEVDLDDFPRAFRKIIGAILVVQKPLRISDLETLIADWNTRTVISHARAVLVLTTTAAGGVTRGDGIPQLPSPYSDYLTSGARYSRPDLFIELNESHAHMATYCLATMHEILRRDICEIRDPNITNDEAEDLEDQLGKHVPEGLYYACLFFTHHFLISCNSFSQLLSRPLWNFYRVDLLNWLEVMSLGKHVPPAIKALKALRDATKSNDAYNKTVTLAEDAMKFAETFENVITSNGCQICIWALPFMPWQTELYKTYKGLVPQWMQVQLLDSHATWTSRAQVRSKANVHFEGRGRYLITESPDYGARLEWDTLAGQPSPFSAGEHPGTSTLVEFHLDEQHWIRSRSGKRVLRIPPSWRGTCTLASSSTHVALSNKEGRVVLLKPSEITSGSGS